MSYSIKNVPLFPTLIHESHGMFKDEYIEKLITTCKSLEFTSGDYNVKQSIDSYLHKDDRFIKICMYVKALLRSIKIAEVYDTTDFEISQMWVNVCEKGIAHHQHWHANSFFSGIIYLTGGAPTVFYDPVIGRQMSSLNVWAETTQPAISLESKPGLIRIFPSYLQHKTLPNDGDEDRISISFNAIPVGEVNTRNPYSRLSQLKISQTE